MDQRVSRRTRREPQQPQFVARAKVGNGWTNIGAAWPLRSGDEGFSLQLTTIPLNWDGRFVLLPPLEYGNGDEREPAAAQGDKDEIPF